MNVLVPVRINLSATTPKGSSPFRKSFASCTEVGVPSVITVAVLSVLNFAFIFLTLFCGRWLAARYLLKLYLFYLYAAKIDINIITTKLFLLKDVNIIA